MTNFQASMSNEIPMPKSQMNGQRFAVRSDVPPSLVIVNWSFIGH